ncbi:calmodulin-binding transcription activator 2-like isoform X2 [Bolinopsis microptera]
MLLFDRTKVRYKTDGYEWKKRKDGKNVREDHMKLKVNGVECLYGAYVHNEAVPNFHRRCYWKLKTPKVVLVHYLYVAEEVQTGPPPISQLHNAISQLQNIFNVPEDELLRSVTSSQNGSPPTSEIQENQDQPSPEVDSTRASQLLLILRKQGHQLKQLIYQDSKNGNLVEDKDTQTDKCIQSTSVHHSCCEGNGACATQNGTSNSTCTMHDSVMHSNSSLSPVPSTSKESERMDTESVHNNQEEDLEQNSLLVSKHNPLLSNSSSDDLNPFLDPILPSLSNGHDDAGSSSYNKNECDMFFNNPDLLKYDLASLKDKDSKLFELFEEADMASNHESFGCPDIPFQHDPTASLHTTVVDVREQENVPVGQKRKYSSNTENNTMELDASVSPHITTISPNITTISPCTTTVAQSITTVAQSSPSENGYSYTREPVSSAEASPVLPTSEYRISITTISPEWAFLAGGEKVVLVGDWERIQGPCCVVFGNTMVPAQPLRNGVLQVVCPASPHPGVVTVHIVGQGVIITDSQTKFTYREQHSPSQWLNVVDSNFKYSLINRLEALESQVRMLSSTQFTGDLQTRMCSISQTILKKLSRTDKLPRAPRGLRLVHLAAAVGYSRLLLLLLKFSSLQECNPCSLDDMGNNALVWACVGGHTPTIYILLRCCPRLRGTRDGWGRPIREVYETSLGNKKGETAARTIQLHYRTYKQKKLNDAAIRIQTRFRTYKQQCTFEQMRRAVVIIQQSYRDHMKTKEVAAKTIQRCWRQTSRQRRVLGLASNTGFY